MLLFSDQISGRGESFQGGQTVSGGAPCGRKPAFDPQKQKLSGSQSMKPSPRPIHVRFVNEADKDHSLRRAPSILKNNS